MNPKKILDVNIQILTISWFHILKYEKGLIHIELRHNFSDTQKQTLLFLHDYFVTVLHIA